MGLNQVQPGVVSDGSVVTFLVILKDLGGKPNSLGKRSDSVLQVAALCQMLWKWVRDGTNPQEHLSPLDLHSSQAVRDALQRLDLGIIAFGEAISRPVIEVVQYRPPPVL